MKLLSFLLFLPGLSLATEWRNTEAEPVGGVMCGFGSLSNKQFGDGIRDTVFIYPKKNDLIVSKHMVLKVTDELASQIRSYTQQNLCFCINVIETHAPKYVDKYAATSEPRPCSRPRGKIRRINHAL